MAIDAEPSALRAESPPAAQQPTYQGIEVQRSLFFLLSALQEAEVSWHGTNQGQLVICACHHAPVCTQTFHT